MCKIVEFKLFFYIFLYKFLLFIFIQTRTWTQSSASCFSNNAIKIYFSFTKRKNKVAFVNPN